MNKQSLHCVNLFVVGTSAPTPPHALYKVFLESRKIHCRRGREKRRVSTTPRTWGWVGSTIKVNNMDFRLEKCRNVEMEYCLDFFTTNKMSYRASTHFFTFLIRCSGARNSSTSIGRGPLDTITDLSFVTGSPTRILIF